MEFDFSNCQTFTLDVNIPQNELRTRAEDLHEDGTPVKSIGEDGLLQFDRLINKLYYAVYSNGELLYTNEYPNAKQAEYDPSTQDFTLEISIPLGTNKDDCSVFLLAASANNNIRTYTKISDFNHYQFESQLYTDGIYNSLIGKMVIIDYTDKLIYAHPIALNKNNIPFDCFCKYLAFSDLDSNANQSVILNRPFCQINILSDEYNRTNPYTISGYSLDLECRPYFTLEDKPYNNFMPFIWNYEEDRVSYLDHFKFELDNISFRSLAIDWNYINEDYIPQGEKDLSEHFTVMFKNRKMHYLAHFVMLSTDKMSGIEIDGHDSSNISLCIDTEIIPNGRTMRYIPSPENGFVANGKYVIYNENSDVVLDISSNKTWNNSTEISYE